MAMYVYAFASDINSWYDNDGREYLLADVLRSLEKMEHRVELPPELIDRAARPIRRMLEMSR